MSYIVSFLHYRTDLNEYVKVSKQYRLRIVAFVVYLYYRQKKASWYPEVEMYKSIDNGDGTGWMLLLRRRE